MYPEASIEVNNEKKKIIQERQIQKIQKLEGSDFAHLFEDVTKLKKTF